MDSSGIMLRLEELFEKNLWRKYSETKDDYFLLKFINYQFEKMRAKGGNIK